MYYPEIDNEKDAKIWELRLYVAGQTPRSVAAFANLKRICEENLAGKYTIEVVDLLKNPQLAAGHVEGFADTFGAVFRAVYDDIAAGRPSPSPAYATFAAGHEEMAIGDAVLESAHTGTWARVAR